MRHFSLIASIILLFSSCANIQNGLYKAYINENDGETILQNEPSVYIFVNETIGAYEQFTMKAYARNAINHQIKRTKLLTHSYYIIVSDNGDYHTISFYGTEMAFYSKGAWALDAISDMTSYRMYLKNNNKWDIIEVFSEDTIDVEPTLQNIINKIDSNTTYYYKDHIINKPNMDNCNTALNETIVLK